MNNQPKINLPLAKRIYLHAYMRGFRKAFTKGFVMGFERGFKQGIDQNESNPPSHRSSASAFPIMKRKLKQKALKWKLIGKIEMLEQLMGMKKTRNFSLTSLRAKELKQLLQHLESLYRLEFQR
ncbi:MAG: hypothetical protein NZL93_04205 [Chthoniobacterales bacterium]|nr:hypothetical protein [Chthoniobacterales bacterium]